MIYATHDMIFMPHIIRQLPHILQVKQTMEMRHRIETKETAQTGQHCSWAKKLE